MKLKNFMYRGVHGWCPEDTWNLDIYLSKVISETTGYLSRTIHGFPPELTFKKWKKILNKISKDVRAVEDFENLIDDQDCKELERLATIAYKKRKQALELFVKYFNNLWD
jgi:hypothetical protein